MVAMKLGKSLGPFTVGHPLGEGGMAMVFDGWHHRDRSPVAIKVMKPSAIAGDPLATSFAHEVRAAAQLNHPHITTVFDHGVFSAYEASQEPSLVGTPWLAMEKVSGGNIRALAGHTHWDTIKTVLLDVLDALGHAHARGLIHRDIKPGNILRDKASGAIKLTDFGLAKSIRQMRVAARKSTMVSGTPGYMSPEQIEGDRQAQGPWSDLYSVGALGWALATGHAPYQGDVTEVLEAHLRGETKQFKPVCPVPRGLEEWLRHAMQTDPMQRFVHAADAAWALRDLGDPVAASSTQSVATPDIFEQQTVQLPTPERTRKLKNPHTARPQRPPPLHMRSSATLRPPFPMTWRSEWQPRTHIHGAGLGLWGLRGVALVGRQEERDQLWACLQRSIVSNQPVLALVDGPHGVGKSTMMQWLSERAYETGQAQTLSFPASSGADGLARIGAMLSDHFRIDGLQREEAVDRVQAALGHLGDDARSTAAALAQLSRPDEIEPSDSGLQVHFDSMAERLTLLCWYLDKLASARPVILILEDIHQDAMAASVVRHILDAVSGAVLCVASVQSLDLASSPKVAHLDGLINHTQSHTVALQQLQGAERIALLRELLGLDPALAAHVEKQTGGNPQFAVQLVGHWIARDKLIVGERGFTLRPGIRAIAPDSMFEMWDKRFEALCEDAPDDEIFGVELAAVLGHTFRRTAWHRALTLASLEVPEPLLEKMARLRLITRSASTDTMAFAHAMFRTAILKRIERFGRRAQWTSIAADALTDDRRSIALRARLLAMSGRVQEAISPLAQAVEEEIETGTRGGARELFRIREELVATMDIDPRSQTAFVSALLGWNLMETRAERMEHIASHFQHLHDWAIELGDHHSQSRILRSYAFSHFDKGDMDTGMRLLDQALHIAERTDAPSWTLCLYAMAAMQSRRGKFEEAKRTTQRMLEVADARGETVRSAQAYSHLSEIALQTHAYDEASELIQKVRVQYESIGSRKGIAITALSEGEIHRARGDLEAAILSYKEAMERGENCENSVALDARINLGITYVASGELAQAKQEFNAALSRDGKDLQVYTMTAIRLGLINCLIAEGNWTQTTHELDEVDAIFTSTKMVDRDFAHLATLAAQKAQAANQTRIARRAWRMAMVQWERLGQDMRAEEAATALQEMAPQGSSDVSTGKAD